MPHRAQADVFEPFSRRLGDRRIQAQRPILIRSCCSCFPVWPPKASSWHTRPRLLVQTVPLHRRRWQW